MKNQMYKPILLLFFLCFSMQYAFAQPPNFVLIVLDDQGWNGSSVQMDPDVPGSVSDFYFTPALELLASQGMTFSQAYAPSPKCSPSRSSILTGRTTARNHFTNTDNDIATGRLLIEPISNTVLSGADIIPI